MADSHQTPTSQDVHAEILRRAYEDQDFRGRLLASPKAAVQEILKDLGLDRALPEELEFEVHLETPNKVHLVVPIPPSQKPPPPPNALSGCTWATTGCWGQTGLYFCA